MMVIFYFFFIFLTGEVGFFVVLLNFFFYLMNYFFSFFSLSKLFIFDLMGLSMGILTVVVFFMMVLSGSFDFFKLNFWGEFMLLVSLFLTFLLMVFLTCNFLMFYLFFEVAVVPIFVMVIGWGYSFNRVQSALYMFLYTFFSSLPLLFTLLNFNVNGWSLFFSLSFYESLGQTHYSYVWVFLLLVFMVKLPVFIFHLWLPKAHVDAPLLGSMVLAGVLLKLGGYGIYSSLIYFFWDVFSVMSWLFSFSMWGGLLMGFLCVRQVDLKSLVAYSSVVHMGPVFSCLCVMNFSGLMGVHWMMFSHGLCSSCMFFLLNLCYFSSSSRSVLVNSGSLFISPVFSFIWFFFCISNMGFPPTFSFFSEFFIMVSVFFESMSFVIFLFFLMMISGFYSIMIFLYYNHGGTKFFTSAFIISLKSLMVVFLAFLYLMGFVYFMGFFVCWLLTQFVVL